MSTNHAANDQSVGRTSGLTNNLFSNAPEDRISPDPSPTSADRRRVSIPTRQRPTGEDESGSSTRALQLANEDEFPHNNTEGHAEDAFDISNKVSMSDLSTRSTQSIDLGNDHWSKDLKCSVCLDYFVEPCILPCGHTFCNKCVKNIIEHTQINRPNVSAQKLKFWCPVCRKSVLAKNFFARCTRNLTLRGIVEGWLGSKEQPVKQPSDIQKEKCVQAEFVHVPTLIRPTTLESKLTQTDCSLSYIRSTDVVVSRLNPDSAVFIPTGRHLHTAPPGRHVPVMHVSPAVSSFSPYGMVQHGYNYQYLTSLPNGDRYSIFPSPIFEEEESPNKNSNHSDITDESDIDSDCLYITDSGTHLDNFDVTDDDEDNDYDNVEDNEPVVYSQTSSVVYNDFRESLEKLSCKYGVGVDLFMQAMSILRHGVLQFKQLPTVFLKSCYQEDWHTVLDGQCPAEFLCRVIVLCYIPTMVVFMMLVSGLVFYDFRGHFYSHFDALVCTLSELMLALVLPYNTMVILDRLRQAEILNLMRTKAESMLLKAATTVGLLNVQENEPNRCHVSDFWAHVLNTSSCAVPRVASFLDDYIDYNRQANGTKQTLRNDTNSLLSTPVTVRPGDLDNEAEE